jgi:FkbM family methyltransferase
MEHHRGCASHSMTKHGFQNGPARRFGKFGKLVRLRRAVRNWPRVLLDHIHLTKADYVCYLRNGATFNVRGGTDDRHVIFELFIDQIYPVQVRAGSVFIDIGAHIGCFTVWAASQGAHVYAYEPFPSNFTALQRNLARNQLKDVYVFNVAVAGTRQTRKLFLPNNKMDSGRYSLYPGRGTETIDVESVTLDEVLSANRLEHVDLLKIDCQGAEYEILYEANPQTLARISAIVVECEYFEGEEKRSADGIAKYLEGTGFVVSSKGNLIHARRPPKL